MKLIKRHIWNTAWLGIILMAQPGMQVARAQQSPYSCELSPNLTGSFAVLFTGTVNLPAPFNAYNGAFYRSGRVIFDGAGNLQTTTITANYAGTILTETFTGTYKVNSDGTFTVSIANLAVPFLPPGTPNVFSFNGTLYNCSNNAKIVLSGVSIAGQAQSNIGSTITGTLDRQ
jgi:hypothetical protein